MMQIEREQNRDSDVINSIKKYIREAEPGIIDLIYKIHKDTMVSKLNVQKL